VDCTLCQHLESELSRLGYIQAKKLKTWWDKGDAASQHDYNALRAAAAGANLDLETARLELNRHIRNEHKAG
jgi:hypothetical protein